MIIPFLRSLYDLEQPAMGLHANYSKLYSEIKSLSLGPQVYHLLKSSGREMDVPIFFREQIYQLYETSFLQSLLIKRETELLLREFESRGIPVIPMKGTMLAERYFGHFAARGTSDIDLLIHPEHMEHAIRCIHQHGFTEQFQDNPEHYHQEWFKTAPGLPEPLGVELHWSFVHEHTSNMNIEAAWATSEPLAGYKHVRTLSPSYTFYALCLHGASHQMDSLKYVIDLLHFVECHRDKLQTDWVFQQACSDHTQRRVFAALTVVQNLFGELESLKSITFQPIRMYRFKTPLFRMLFTLSMLDSWRYRMAHVARLLFPSRAFATYSLDEDRHPKSLVVTYYHLYKQRMRKLIEGIREGV